MAETSRPPHDRGHVLWSAEDGPTRMLQASFDRWVGAVLADDGIDMPFMGGSHTVEATVVAKADGIVVGTAAIDHMLQIWAPSLRLHGGPVMAKKSHRAMKLQPWPDAVRPSL